MNSGQPSTRSRRSKMPSTFFWLWNSLAKYWLSFFAARIWSALLIITNHATMERISRQKMTTLPSTVARSQMYSNSIWLDLSAIVARKPGTFIPSRYNHVLLGREEFYAPKPAVGQRQRHL